MNYKQAKISNDGSHYIATPKENFPRPRKRKAKPKQDTQVQDESFEKAYEESKALPKKQREKYIKEQLKEVFAEPKKAVEFAEKKIEQKTNNAIRRKVRLMRKVHLQEWDYFCTFTYDDTLHTEESFKQKLSNTLKHFVQRKGWKYIGVWERSPEKNRLHFHGIFYTPEMKGEIIETRDYSTKSKKMQVAHQNTHFLKHFGRNDFEPLGRKEDTMQAVRYLMKYMEKTGEKLVYGGKLPTYFVSDILEEDIACEYGVDGRKFVLFDNFYCIKDGEIVGQVCPEVIKQMPKAN